VSCRVLQSVAERCRVLQSGIFPKCSCIHCGFGGQVCVLQCVAQCCSVLHSVAVCCSVLQSVAVRQLFEIRLQSSWLWGAVLCAAVCCSLLQSVVVRGSVLQIVAVYCSVAAF